MDKEKKLKLMRFWLFGTNAILFSATTLFAGIFTGTELLKLWQYWFVMAFAAGLSVLAYVLYKSYLDKQ